MKQLIITALPYLQEKRKILSSQITMVAILLFSVTIEGVPSSHEELTLETCAGVPILYNGTQLSIGEQRTFTFKNVYGCDSTIVVNINGKGFAGMNGVPNIFSPNNDGINDCFHPYFGDNLVFQQYKLQIFNRWGSLIFSSTDPYACWKGNFNNQPIDEGVYVWLIEMATEDCEELSLFQGDVALIR